MATAALLPFMTSTASATGPTSVTGLSVTPTTYAAHASDIEYALSFTATSAIPSGGSVTLTAPSGATFLDDPNAYFVTIGGTGTEPSSVTTTGNNVVEVDMPSAVSASETVTIDAYGAANPTTTGSDSFSVATATDTAAASTGFTVTSACQTATSTSSATARASSS
jgi:hypothetical protein